MWSGVRGHVPRDIILSRAAAQQPRIESSVWLLNICCEYKIQGFGGRRSQIMKSWSSSCFIALTRLRITQLCIWNRHLRHCCFCRRWVWWYMSLSLEIRTQVSVILACGTWACYLIFQNFFNWNIGKIVFAFLLTT